MSLSQCHSNIQINFFFPLVSLEDLLMWPVNRMQRTSLYIEELLLRTPDSSPDKEALKEALW